MKLREIFSFFRGLSFTSKKKPPGPSEEKDLGKTVHQKIRENEAIKEILDEGNKTLASCAGEFSQDNSAFGIIDVQVDFCSNNGAPGSLEVKGSDEIVPVINKTRALFKNAFLTQDFHPSRHISFATSHGKSPYSIKKITKFDMRKGSLHSTSQNQMLWPDHCVQGTPGAGFHKDLNVDELPIFRKGRDRFTDSYGMFENNFGGKDSELEDALQKASAQEKPIKNLFLSGIALDVCVFFSCQQAIKKGYRVVLLLDACAAVEQDPRKIAEKLNSLQDIGVIITTADEMEKQLQENISNKQSSKNMIVSSVTASKSEPTGNITPTKEDLAVSPPTLSQPARPSSNGKEVKSEESLASEKEVKSEESPASEKEVKNEESLARKTAHALKKFLEDEMNRLFADRSGGQSHQSKALDSKKLLSFQAIWISINKALAKSPKESKEEQPTMLKRQSAQKTRHTGINQLNVDAWGKEISNAANQHEGTGLKGFLSQLFRRPTRSATAYQQNFAEKHEHCYVKSTTPQRTL